MTSVWDCGYTCKNQASIAPIIPFKIISKAHFLIDC